MAYYKFKETDIFFNRIEAFPKKRFFVFNSKVLLANQSQIVGAFTGSVPNVPPGFVNLYELNVDRPSGSTGRMIGAVEDQKYIYPFITKNGNLMSFRTISTSSFNTDYAYGDIISSSYPLSASITREYFTASTDRPNEATHIGALKNTLNYYKYVSDYYAFSASFGNKGVDALNLISIPSIFYGSSMKRGTVDLKFYITGTLIGELKDENQNGELIQVGPAGSNGSGSKAGVVLYKEGFLVLTGSWKLFPDGDTSPAELDYEDDGSSIASSWLFYGVGANDGIPADPATPLSTTRASASYDLVFSGSSYVPVTTMLATAPRGELNYSNNPTYINLKQQNALMFRSSSIAYRENSKQKIKNTVKSPYTDPTGSYKPQTFISRIGIFDEDKNLIAIAKVATPVKKTEERDLTFKLKLDF